MPISIEDIQEEFSDLDLEVTDDSVLIQLQALCGRYNIDANKISCEYFSYNTKHKANQAPTIESLVTFENDKLKNMKKDKRTALDPIEGIDNLPSAPDLGTPTNNHTQAKRHITPENHLSKRFVSAIGSPLTPSMRSSGDNLSQSILGGGAAASTKYSERKNKREVTLKFGDTEGEDWSPSKESSLSIKPYDEKTALTGPYKFMFERLRDRAAVLDETICRLGERLTVKYGLGEAQDTNVPQPEQHTVIGRVACDAEGRLNSNSVVIQGSMDTCGGHVIPLDVRNITEYSMFPGQIVGLDSSNPNTSRLLASKVHSNASTPPPPPTLSPGSSLSVVVACGPYTTSDTFLYRPLHDILDYIKEKSPDVAILTGPFVDAKHPKIEEATESFDNMFDEIYNAINSVLDEVKTHVVLVPSTRDAHHEFVYPTPPFGLYGPSHELYNPRLHSVSDPSLLNINGVLIGVTSTDILLHLGKEEIAFPPRTGDRLKRLASHVTQQQSFYPLYPPSDELNVDYEKFEQHAGLPLSPHLLLLPSDLVHFVKEVEPGCVAVNPGRITKGTGPGMFARLKVTCSEDETNQPKLDVKAEIVRI